MSVMRRLDDDSRMLVATMQAELEHINRGPLSREQEAAIRTEAYEQLRTRVLGKLRENPREVLPETNGS